MRAGKAQFAAIPHRASSDERLTATHFRVLAVIAWHDRFGANGRGCVASHNTLSREARVHPKTLSVATRTLEVPGYITVGYNEKDWRRRVYRVAHDVAFERSEQERTDENRPNPEIGGARTTEITKIGSRENVQASNFAANSAGNIFPEGDLNKFGEVVLPENCRPRAGRSGMTSQGVAIKTTWPDDRYPDRRPGESIYQYHRRKSQGPRKGKPR